MTRRLKRLGLIGLAVAVAASVSASAASARTVSTTFTQCISSGAPLLDHGSVRLTFPITVPKNRGRAQLGAVTDVNAAIRFDHTFNGDTSVWVINPAGTPIALELGRGGTGDNYGSGLNSCGGTPVFFDDAFLTSISTVPSGTVAGFFKPEQFLSGFNGGPAAGTWSILLADSAGGDVGVFGGASLTVSYTYLQNKKKKKKKKK